MASRGAQGRGRIPRFTRDSRTPIQEPVVDNMEPDRATISPGIGTPRLPNQAENPNTGEVEENFENPPVMNLDDHLPPGTANIDDEVKEDTD